MQRLLMTVALCLSVSSFAQTPQEIQTTKPDISTNIMSKQIVDLSLIPRTPPPAAERFDLAVTDEKGLCKIHHQLLSVAKIPIQYGFLPAMGVEKRIEKAKFPNAITEIEGGCVVIEVKEAKVLHCPKCLAAKRKWIEDRKHQMKL